MLICIAVSLASINMAAQEMPSSDRTSLVIIGKIERRSPTATHHQVDSLVSSNVYSNAEMVDRIETLDIAPSDSPVNHLPSDKNVTRAGDEASAVRQTDRQIEEVIKTKVAQELESEKMPQVVVFRLPTPDSTSAEPITPEHIAVDHAPASAAMIAQLSWAEVKYYTEMTLQDMSSVSAKLLEELEPKYIATAIVRERGEVELLESERIERQTHRNAVRPWLRNTASHSLLSLSCKSRASTRPVLERGRSFCGSSYFPESGRSILVESQTPLDSPLGSQGILTPRSEAAAGQMFQKAAFAHATASTPSNNKPASSAVMQGVDVRRLLQDAAWKWIDQHVDEYADDVEHADGAEHKSQKVLWDELVSLRRQKERLNRALDSLIVT